MSSPVKRIHFKRIVERGNGWKLCIALVAVVLNGICNHLQKESTGTLGIPGSDDSIPVWLHGLLAGYGEAFFGTVALGIILRIIETPVLWILAMVLVAGLLWETFQHAGLIPGTADYVGDLPAYLTGALLGSLIGRPKEIHS